LSTADDDESARYLVLIEEQEARGPVTVRSSSVGRTPGHGGRAPRRAARAPRTLTDEPRHPSSLQQRGTFRVTDDEYLTIVEGRC